MRERLTNLLAVTDVRLTRLDVDDLLVEVLERLRAILDVDTAAVLLLERGTDDYLVARAASGLEEEVRQGVRVPIGAGFAGTIAARKEPVILDRVDSTTVANPILSEKGIRRMVGVPLFSGTDVMGVLHVGRLQDQSFNSDDVELLQIAGERVSAAIQTRQIAVESAAGAMLERELLPTHLPAVAGLEFAARYAPAEDRSIGGDWYDAFVLPSGELWVLIGDVAGHGLASAVMVSRVKSAVRSYALLGGDDAAHVLTMTNRKLLHFEIDTMVTLLCAVAKPPFERFAIASAGHPPPVVASGHGAELARVLPGPPLGAVDEPHYSTTYVTLDPGSTMLLYTDGLVERRGEAIDSGLARLRDAVANVSPEQMCRDVMRRLVGSNPTLDDVALLAVGRTPDPSVSAGRSAATGNEIELIAEMNLPPQSRSVAEARRFALRAAGDVSKRTGDALKLLVSELATNCVVHARSDFTVRILRSANQIRVECSDADKGAVLVQHPGPSDTSGRGMYFVLRFAHNWGVEQSDRRPGKTVWFSLRLESTERPDGGRDSPHGGELSA
ncbi:MAG TPA: SpoIIE family protein phosphatase [Jatrophihabitans sp.]